MAKKPGRPPKIKKQEKFVGFFVTKVQHFVIQQKATKAGVNISDYMRQMAIYGQVKVKWSEEERGMVKQLINISTDIHRLTQIAEKEGATQSALFFAKYQSIIDTIINTLCHDR